MSSKLSGSVGYGGDNQFSDIVAVQLLLNHHIGFDEALAKRGLKPLVPDGNLSDKWNMKEPTIAAIEQFQLARGLDWVDGRVDVGGDTWDALKGTPSASKMPSSSKPTGSTGGLKQIGLSPHNHAPTYRPMDDCIVAPNNNIHCKSVEAGLKAYLELLAIGTRVHMKK